MYCPDITHTDELKDGETGDTCCVAICRGRRTRTTRWPRAAERVFVTQPALSLTAKKLKEELGTTIFERRQNRVEPTSLGEHIVQQAQRVLDEAGQIKMLATQGKDVKERKTRCHYDRPSLRRTKHPHHPLVQRTVSGRGPRWTPMAEKEVPRLQTVRD